jgi:hypothetical protein
VQWLGPRQDDAPGRARSYFTELHACALPESDACDPWPRVLVFSYMQISPDRLLDVLLALFLALAVAAALWLILTAM